MVYRCLNCGAATKYDAKIGRMVCDSCCSIWDPALLQAQSIPENEIERKTPEEQQKERSSFGATATLDCPVYHCTACGAKLLINEVESATYCAYCGQPTVIFDRISQQKQPKYLIPFRINKALATEKVKARLSSGSFIPKEIQNVKPEHVRGIYIPYKLIDLDYNDVQIYIEQPSKKKAEKRARDLFVYKMKQQIKQEDRTIPTLFSEDPEINIKKMEDILLPAWFFVFRYRNKSYTIMVNGQTGKVVGTVPIDRARVFMTFLPLTLAFTLLIFIVLFIVITPNPELLDALIEGTTLAGLLVWLKSIRLWKQYENSKTLTMDLQMQDYSKIRVNEQEGD